jgi:hypothetical protein
MNLKVNVQTKKAKVDVCLRQSLMFLLNLDLSLAGLSWPLFIGSQVLRNRLGSIQTRRIWRFTYRFPYSNIIHFDFYFGPMFLWAFTRICLRGTNIMRLGSHTLVIKCRIPLSVPPYGSGNTPYMIETSLQSMINSGLWKVVLTPVHSTIKSSLIRKHHILVPSSHDTRSCPRSD